MIRTFRHKGLQRFYEKAERKGISAEMLPKVERIIARLDVASSSEMMNVPGFKLHSLKGEQKGFWSVWVTGNWRITFRFAEGHVFEVDLVDYH